MKKNMLSILIAAAGTMLSAAELNVSGNFARLQTSGFPHDWYLNGYAGYKPEPKFDSVAENGLRILHFSDIKGKSGFGVSSRKPFACSAGKCTANRYSTNSFALTYFLPCAKGGATAFPIKNYPLNIIFSKPPHNPSAFHRRSWTEQNL